MISNDIILNSAAFAMLFCLLVIGFCFFIFVYRVLGGVRPGREPLLYFNFVFFGRSFLSGFSLFFIILTYISAALLEYRRGFDEILFLANLIGGLSYLFYAIYGKFFFKGKVFLGEPFFFVKVYLTRFDLSLGAVFLWLSRFSYVIWLAGIASL